MPCQAPRPSTSTAEVSGNGTTLELGTLSSLPQRPAIDLDFQDVSYAVSCGWRKAPKKILHSVSGTFKSRELSAILGSSGAGKSTLLNILSGYRSTGTTGSIRINGHPRNMKEFHKLSCYIMQDDLHQPHLTVAEGMTIAANLKLGNKLTSEQKSNLVTEILTTLGLQHCRDTRSERLSGGERKRLSLALEFVSDPPVVFLDEPTSGLDCVSIRQCISMLRTLAHQGRTIVCTIHQPSASVLKMFDRAYFLASGRCVYQGPTGQLVPFLSSIGIDCPLHYNPADYMIEITHSDMASNIQTFSAAVQNGKHNYGSSENELSADCALKDKVTETHIHRRMDYSNRLSNFEFSTSFWTQFTILLKRMFLQMKRNSIPLKIQFFHHIFCGIFWGLLFYGMGNDAAQTYTIVKFLVGVLVFFIYSHCMIPALLYPFEVKLLKREYFNRWYGLKAYYMAFTFTKLPSQIILGMIYIFLTYLLTGQPLEPERFFRFSLICLLIGLISEGIGWFVSCIFKSASGVVIVSGIIIPLLIMAVYGLEFARFISSWMRNLMLMSYVRLGLVGTVTSLYGEQRDQLDCSEDFCLYKHPELMLRDLGLGGASYWLQVMGLVGNLLFFRGLCYVALRWRLDKNNSLRFLHRIFR